MTPTVLVVEDELELRETMRDALELNGYTVVAAQDGQEALEVLGRIERIGPVRIGLVLLDLVMPRMNGWDLLDRMRALPQLAEVPVIVHTSLPDQAPPGVTRVLKKPLEFRHLLSVVHEFCGN